jgi:hypothetical protein
VPGAVHILMNSSVIHYLSVSGLQQGHTVKLLNVLAVDLCTRWSPASLNKQFTLGFTSTLPLYCKPQFMTMQHSTNISYLLYIFSLYVFLMLTLLFRTEVSQSAWCLITDCYTGRTAFDLDRGKGIFSSSVYVQKRSGANSDSYRMGSGGPFSGAKARPGRDADDSPTSSADVKNDYELYLLSTLATSWRVLGML